MVTKKIFDAQTLAASGSAISQIFDLDTVFWGKSAQGFCTVQHAVTGSGTPSVTPQYSNDGTNFIDGDATELSGASGMTDITLMAARYLRFKVAETGGSATVTVTLTINLS